MVLCKFRILFYLALNLTVATVWAQTNEFDAVRGVSSSLNQFALRFLADIAEEAGDSLNLAISPYTVWSLMTIIYEGARENTARQLEDALKIPQSTNKDLFRRSYKSLSKYLLQNTEGVQLDINAAMFADKEFPVNRTYQTVVKNFYGVEIVPTDFHNLVQAVNTINTYVSSATRKKIQNFVKIDDIIDATVLLASTLFFKGQWKIPFNKTATFTEKFLDESGNNKGNVKMMYQVGTFPYSILTNLKAHAVELPYGNGDRISMIVILPRKGETLQKMLQQLSTMPFSNVLDTLANAEQQYGEEEVQVYLPKFTIYSDLNLNRVLNRMGIKDAFDLEKANLLGMFPHLLYVTRVIQQAKIEVNEEGTTASAAAGAGFAYKSPPPKFYANKPFAYFIVDKPTRSVIFAGKVSNPSTICNVCLNN